MSSREGPHAVGIGASANTGRAPTWPNLSNPMPIRGDGMSSKQGFRTSANNGQAPVSLSSEFMQTQTEVPL